MYIRVRFLKQRDAFLYFRATAVGLALQMYLRLAMTPYMYHSNLSFHARHTGVINFDRLT